MHCGTSFQQIFMKYLAQKKAGNKKNAFIFARILKIKKT
jgi:hypothetical protein